MRKLRSVCCAGGHPSLTARWHPKAVNRGSPSPTVRPVRSNPFGWNNHSAEHGTEDCLFLNVWAPVGGSKHPVMVYIHGGSNTAGSAAEELSNGFALVPKGVLLVTFDYRLGIFGFFRTQELDDESAMAVPATMA